MKIDTALLVKTLKAILSLTSKDDKILLTLKEQTLIIQKPDYFTFILSCDYSGINQTVEVLASEFTTLSKLVKKEQVGHVYLDLEHEVLTTTLPNGLTLTSFFEPLEYVDTSEKLTITPLYLPSADASMVSKIIQKQKDLNYINILNFGLLFIGDRQVSFYKFFPILEEHEENFTELSTNFSNTQLNNLVNIKGEIGMSESNNLLWGYTPTTDQLNLLDTPQSDFQFEVLWPKLQDNLVKFTYDNWKELKTRFERESSLSTLTIVNTKHLEKLISSSKTGINDPYDLCVLESNSEKQQLSLYFYQNKQLKNSFSMDSEVEITEDLEVNLQVKHLLSMLQTSNNQLTIQYLGEGQPILASTDSGVESIVMQSLLV